MVIDSSTALTRSPSSNKRCASAGPPARAYRRRCGFARRPPDWTRGACWSEAARHPPPPLRCAESCAHPVQAH
eukprot:5370901-Pleurochrysis_carterae.AAC.1